MNSNCLTLVFVLILTVVTSDVMGQKNQEADTSDTTLIQLMEQNTYPIELEDGEINGKGAEWLIKKSKEATIVSMGESHATQEIPAMIKALIEELQAAGEFSHLAIEVSPWTTERMMSRLRQGKDAYDDFITEYPVAVPFYNWKNERDLLLQVVQNSKAESPLIGLDQIFSFSTPLVLDRLKELSPSPQVRAKIERVEQKGETLSADDSRLQNLPSSMPVPVSAYDPMTFDTLRSHFDGVPEAKVILDELITSIEIYRLNSTNNYKSNQIRARYLRDNFREAVQNIRAKSDKTPQILIKTGAMHAYRGMTPNNALDVGNLAISMARSMGGEAFNVAFVCGPGGEARSFPSDTTSCWPERLGEPLKKYFKDQPVLIDLTAIHPILHEGEIKLQDELEDFLWSFDAVIVLPETTPAEPIASP